MQMLLSTLRVDQLLLRKKQMHLPGIGDLWGPNCGASRACGPGTAQRTSGKAHPTCKYTSTWILQEQRYIQYWFIGWKQ